LETYNERSELYKSLIIVAQEELQRVETTQLTTKPEGIRM